MVVATALFLLISCLKQGAGGVAPAEVPVRFDREREGREVEFPALDELVERDRLWPPDLSTLPRQLCLRDGFRD